ELARSLSPFFRPPGAASAGPGGRGPGQPSLFLVFGCLAGKELDPMLEALLPLADGLVATRPRESRTRPEDPAAIARAARRFTDRVWTAGDALEALRLADGLRGPGDWICLCGSLYLVGEVKGRLQAGERWFRGRTART